MVESNNPHETLEQKQRRWAREANQRIGQAPTSEPLGKKPESRPIGTPLAPGDLRK